ncbi:MAG: DUF3333 domain-containing protein, partial [Porticoccaceae bacterium]
MSNPMDNLDKIKQSLTRRNRAETRFRWYGRIAILIGLAAVILLFTDIISKGHGAFRVTYIQLDVHYDQDVIGVANMTDPAQLADGNWGAVPKNALRAKFSDVSGRRDKRKLYGLL